MDEESVLAQEHAACGRLDQLAEQYALTGRAAAQSVCQASGMLPHHIARLDAILTQMQRQARQLRACQLGLRVLRGGRSG